MVASISAVSSASAAASYYGKDNYYARGSDEPDPSSWFGKGAKALGLSGSVDVATFERVMRGETLNGRRIGQRQNESFERAASRSHRPGIDLTFSPSKDVSLLLYLGGDKRILEAHRAAVDTTLKWTEKHLAAARIRSGPEPPKPIRTGNLVIAKFEHDISRDRDPQLHTHAVVANMTQSEDGRWRALHNEPLFQHAKLAGLAYDAEMRQQLRGLGYQVKLDDGRNGRYSVIGVPSEAREEFSRGHMRVVEAAEKLDHNTPATRKAVSLKTRPAKVELSQEQRSHDWQERGAPWKEQLGRTIEAAKEKQALGRIERPLSTDDQASTKNLGRIRHELMRRFFRPTPALQEPGADPYRSRGPTSDRQLSARAATSFGLRHLEEREAAFSLHHVRRAAIEHGADGLTLKDIDRELTALRRRKLVRTNCRDPDAETVTARSLQQEQKTAALIRTAGRTDPLLPKASLTRSLESTNLTEGQKAAITTIFAGTDRLVGIQGYAGTGKTTMMQHAASIAADLKPPTDKAGLSILGLAPTHSAARSLQEGGGFEAQTVAKFLSDLRRGEGPKNLRDKIVLIDESSFLSTKSMNHILGRVLPLEPARLILIGDRRQHGAVEAGRPFDLAQRNGMTTAVMKDVIRLPKDDVHLHQRAAVEAAAEGRVAHALKRLEANTTEAPGKLAETAADKWSELASEKQQQALIVAPGHRLRKAINEQIRGRMAESGALGTERTTLSTSTQKDITRAEALSARSYQEGDILSFHRRVDALNVKCGDSRTIVAIDEAKGTVTLKNSRGGIQTVPIRKLIGKRDDLPFSIMTKSETQLRPGDRMMFTRTAKESGIASLDRADIVRFDDSSVTLKLGGEQKSFNRSDPALASLTHAYAVTSHASQGQTAKDVIAVVDSSERQLTNQAAFYVGISRSADTLALVVDDKERVMDTLHRNTGLKSSSTEAAARMESLTNLDKDPVAHNADQGSGAENTQESQVAQTQDNPTEASHDEPDRDLGTEMSL
ncbi:MAG: MobF family relaxase [Pseudomonadota bacterium]